MSPLKNSYETRPTLYPPPNFGLIGHRGAAGLAPENTLASFKAAKALGLNWIEFDIQCSQSHEWVVFHDDTLERVSALTGKLREMSWEKLKRTEVGSWFGPRFQEEKILLFSEALDICRQLKLMPNIEIKGNYSQDPQALHNMVSLLEKHWLLNRAQNNSEGPLLSPLISSFEVDNLIFLKSIAKNYTYGLLQEEFDPSAFQIIAQYDFFSLHCNYKSIPVEAYKIIQNQSIPVLAYTVNDVKTAKELIENGISAIFSDFPNLIIESFE